MEQLRFDRPAPAPSPRLARLTRHLTARLLDFDPGGPQVEAADEARGLVSVRFPGRDLEQVLAGLEEYGVRVSQAGELALFWLDPALPFESLDCLWGCLFDILEG